MLINLVWLSMRLILVTAVRDPLAYFIFLSAYDDVSQWTWRLTRTQRNSDARES